jgi:hypothetical protein
MIVGNIAVKKRAADDHERPSDVVVKALKQYLGLKDKKE